MMRPTAAVLVLLAALALPAAGAAGQGVGTDPYGGLHFAVAAPEGASWRLDCRFRPVAVEMSAYDRRHWVNSLTREGQGLHQGRLPGDNGRCTLTKTGGPGPVGLAIIKDGTPHSAGTNDPARPAMVQVF